MTCPDEERLSAARAYLSVTCSPLASKVASREAGMSCCLQAEGNSAAAIHFALVMQQLLQVTPLFQVLGDVNTETDLLDDEMPEPPLAGAQSGQLVGRATAICSVLRTLHGSLSIDRRQRPEEGRCPQDKVLHSCRTS